MTTFGESCIIGMLLGEFKGILLCIFAVEAYTASWIEMLSNLHWDMVRPVEAYTASWIEIPDTVSERVIEQSRLIQPRGLKFTTTDVKVEAIGRGLYSLVD